ncbi:MAG: T9SS type A sorting domain-containing protein [Bacteroidia bacterium]|jgi:hypothetical protein|nr:T9SS type A sorting domain-containing protein [Bacteroidia bacterium]
MKKIYLTLFTLTGVFCIASAQIQLTANSAYNVGDSANTQDIDPVPIFPTSSGANVPANYSNVTPTGGLTPLVYISPVGTPYATLFNNATVVVPAVSLQGVSGYSYYTKTNTEVNLIGVGSPSYIMNFSNPQLLLKFPIAYGDSILDAFNASYEVNGALVKRSGTVTSAADAWGDITTPRGTEPYLRLNTTQEIVDSFFIEGELFQRGETFTRTYNYFGVNMVAPLFSYSTVISTFGSTEFASYLVDVTTSVNNQPFTNIEQALAYPNPIQNNTLYLDFDLVNGSNLQISIIDITGKSTVLIPSFVYHSGKHQLAFDMSSMANGVYNVLIQNKNGVGKSLRVVKH